MHDSEIDAREQVRWRPLYIDADGILLSHAYCTKQILVYPITD